MKVSKIALVAALSLSAVGAMAGEIVNSAVTATAVGNTSAGLASTALQNIGVSENNGHIGTSTVLVNGAFNTAAGLASTATQNVGHTSGNGRIDNTFITGNGLVNTAAGLAATGQAASRLRGQQRPRAERLHLGRRRDKHRGRPRGHGHAGDRRRGQRRCAAERGGDRLGRVHTAGGLASTSTQRIGVAR
jgi:hypothetical protein